VIILFLAALSAAIFMVMISRNITRTGRIARILQATQLAEAGLRYAEPDAALFGRWRRLAAAASSAGQHQ